MLWRASAASIRDSVSNAIDIARTQQFESIAFPIIGSGSGGMCQEKAVELMRQELDALDYEGRAVIVRYAARKAAAR